LRGLPDDLLVSPRTAARDHPTSDRPPAASSRFTHYGSPFDLQPAGGPADVTGRFEIAPLDSAATIAARRSSTPANRRVEVAIYANDEFQKEVASR